MEYAASRLLPEDFPCGLGFFCLFINGLFFLYRGDVLYKRRIKMVDDRVVSPSMA